MELPFFDVIGSQPSWVFLLVSVASFEVSRCSLCLLKWIYTYFLRRPKNVLDYGSWAMVTGPTEGIGKALAFEMARRGLSLVLVDRSSEFLSQVAERIKEEVPAIELVTVVFDLSRDIPEGISRLEKAVEGLDIGILINNAGVSYAVPKCLHEVDENMYRELANVNMEALTEITRIVLPGMIKKKNGAIVNIGSGSSVITPTYPMFAVYTGTKGYVNSLSRSLHHEYNKFGIDIQCQIPSFVVTKMVPDKRRSFFNPTPEEYAGPTLDAIGYGTTVLPYWRHSIQRFLAKLVPERILVAWLLHSAIRRRKNYPSR